MRHKRTFVVGASGLACQAGSKRKTAMRAAITTFLLSWRPERLRRRSTKELEVDGRSGPHHCRRWNLTNHEKPDQVILAQAR